MATGDNVLTAISVARECEIIPPDIEVFLGDLQLLPDGKQDIVWKSTSTTKHALDKDTLQPNEEFYSDNETSS